MRHGAVGRVMRGGPTGRAVLGQGRGPLAFRLSSETNGTLSDAFPARDGGSTLTYRETRQCWAFHEDSVLSWRLTAGARGGDRALGDSPSGRGDTAPASGRPPPSDTTHDRSEGTALCGGQ